MNHDHSLKELLLLPDGPPEGVWQAAMDFAFTSDNETPDYLVPDNGADNISQTSETDVDVDAEEDADDQTDDLPAAAFEDQGEEIDPLLPSSGPGDLDETGEDYGV
ncbi:hypothetical protein FDW83_11250 [Pseudarthrobacter sp. NamE2]|uniref:hypothetical protein n=1 Tax=Pseudarthrobacter sp. NamE2 TaxID=2576838 RepID=UPI0010FD502D|nr:hypothetical protein [Pseudarthrobacter sp. NamE2]TLM82967.1 hypothetical protein FDW83_11250 [Pseudarthrobacter sp. NamE2]